MSPFVLMLLCCLAGSAGSVALAGAMLALPEGRLRPLAMGFIPYAIGTLLGAAFIGMLPHALEQAPARQVLPVVMLGLVVFFLLEKVSLWRHCHEQPCDIHTRAGTLILLGDSLHNFVDGVAIAVSFSSSVSLGVATSLAVVAHEIPQEAGDFAILLQSGYSRRKAFFWNFLASLATLPGALLAWLFLPVLRGVIPFLLAFSAASFIYIALADLIPGRRVLPGWRVLVAELCLIGLGVGTILLFHALRKA